VVIPAAAAVDERTEISLLSTVATFGTPLT
jgi:hypothetical protein